MGKISQKTKEKAVGEVLCEQGTLVVISEKYGISSAYLSNLANRAKRLLEPKGYKIDFDEPLLQIQKKEIEFVKMIKTVRNVLDEFENNLKIT
jgi:3'-phosphoadenosine 5'-phosphosulfate sulfotransferase (PAPS reductase)/FAD synthetase